MSRLPIEGQVGPASSVRSRRGFETPRVGQTESLGVFGITPMPVIESQGLKDAQALMKALGVVDRSLAVSAAEMDRQRALAEQEARENERVYRGLGAERALEIGPQLLDDVRTGKVAPAEGEDMAAFADRLIRERAALPDDDQSSPIQFSELRERLSGGIQNEAIRRRTIQTEMAKEELTNLTVSGAAGKDAASLREAASEVRRLNPELSEQAAIERVAVQSLGYAALQGDRVAFEEAASLLPENSVERLKYRNELNRTLDARQREAENAFNTRIAGLYVDIENGEASYEQVRETILSSRGTVSDASIDRELQQWNARTAAELRLQQQLALDLEDSRDSEAVIEAWTDLASRAYETRGFARLPDSIEWTNSAGETQKLTRSEIIEEASERRFAQIDAMGLPPERAIAEKTGFLADNGVKYEPWARVMQAGYYANIQAFTAAKKNGERVTELPANMRDGYATWKMVNANNPAVANMHVDEKAGRLYSMAALAEQYVDKGQPEAALLRAVNATGNRPVGAISDKAVMERASWVGDTFNAQDTLAQVRDVADLYLGSGVVPDVETAIKKASETVRAAHRKINGSWVNISNRNVPPNIEQIADFAAKDYAAQYGESEGITAKNITLKPGSTPGTWEMIDKRTMLPVEQAAWRVITDAQLAEIDLRRQDAVQAEIAARQAAIPARQAAQRDALAGAIEASVTPVGMDGLASQVLRPGTQAGLLAGSVLGKKFSAKYVRPVGEAFVNLQSWYERRAGETDEQYRLRTRRRGGLD